MTSKGPRVVRERGIDISAILHVVWLTFAGFLEATSESCQEENGRGRTFFARERVRNSARTELHRLHGYIDSDFG